MADLFLLLWRMYNKTWIIFVLTFFWLRADYFNSESTFFNLKFEKLSENKFFCKTVFDSSQKVWMGLIYERIFFNSQALSLKLNFFNTNIEKKVIYWFKTLLAVPPNETRMCTSKVWPLVPQDRTQPGLGLHSSVFWANRSFFAKKKSE